MTKFFRAYNNSLKHVQSELQTIDEEQSEYQDVQPESILEEILTPLSKKSYTSLSKSDGTEKTKIVGILNEIVSEVTNVKTKLDLLINNITTSTEATSLVENLSIMRSNIDDTENLYPGEWLHTHLMAVHAECVERKDLSLVPYFISSLFSKINSFVLPMDGKEILDTKNSQGTEIEQKKNTSEEKCQRKPDVEEYDLGQPMDLISLKKSQRAFNKLKNKEKNGMGWPSIGVNVVSVKQWTYNENGARIVKYYYICPFRNCVTSCRRRYRSPRTVDAHINRLFGYEYGPCAICDYRNANKDSYSKHNCQKRKIHGPLVTSTFKKIRKRDNEHDCDGHTDRHVPVTQASFPDQYISGQKMAPEHKYISELTKHHDQDMRDREGEISHQETEPGQGSGDEKHYVEKDYHDSEIPSRKKLKKRKHKKDKKKRKTRHSVRER